MTEHKDPHKMRPAQLEACGCDRCQDNLRLHDQLDQLIAASDEIDASLSKLEDAVTQADATITSEIDKLRDDIRQATHT